MISSAQSAGQLSLALRPLGDNAGGRQTWPIAPRKKNDARRR